MLMDAHRQHQQCTQNPPADLTPGAPSPPPLLPPQTLHPRCTPHVRRRRSRRPPPPLLLPHPNRLAPAPRKYACSLPLTNFLLIMVHRFHPSRQIAYSHAHRPAGASEGAAREASGSFIHSAAVVHPDAAIGQVKSPACTPTRARTDCSHPLQLWPRGWLS